MYLINNLSNYRYRKLLNTNTIESIVKQLVTLDASKATGPDGIPAKVLKETVEEIVPYLVTIFQQSIDIGRVHLTGHNDMPMLPPYCSTVGFVVECKEGSV